jgi:hypothetical protein
MMTASDYAACLVAHFLCMMLVVLVIILIQT